MNENAPAQEKIRRAINLLAVATIALFLLSIGLGAYFYFQAQETRAALCTLRDDLQVRVDASRNFLVEHPRGIPGISAAVIQQGIANQQRTIDSLKSLNCS